MDEGIVMIVTTQYSDLEAFGSFAATCALFIKVVAPVLVFFGSLYPVGTLDTCQ